MSTASTASPSASFHARPHSPAIHHHHRTYHHSPHPHTPPHLRQNGPKRSVSSSSTSLVAHNKGQGQIKSSEKREKEKERKRGRVQGNHVDHSTETKGSGVEEIQGDGPVQVMAVNGIDQVQLPPTPESTIKLKDSASLKSRSNEVHPKPLRRPRNKRTSSALHSTRIPNGNRHFHRRPYRLISL